MEREMEIERAMGWDGKMERGMVWGNGKEDGMGK